MIGDILIMIWKEWRELLLPSGRSRRQTATTVVVGLVILGLVFRAGPLMVRAPQALWAPSLIVFFMMMAMVADSFAGERERHTLETLFASRLSDLSILIGKIGAAVTAGWGLIALLIVLGVAGNSAHLDGISGQVSWNNIIAVLAFALLLSILFSCFGVLVSLRAATVRQATQVLSFATTAVMLAVILGFRKLPLSWHATVMHALANAGRNLARTATIAALVLIVLNLLLFTAARLRFQRSRLSLD